MNEMPEGVWYVVKWDIQYPAGTEYSSVVVTCVDGFELLSLDLLDCWTRPRRRRMRKS